MSGAFVNPCKHQSAAHVLEGTANGKREVQALLKIFQKVRVEWKENERVLRLARGGDVQTVLRV